MVSQAIMEEYRRQLLKTLGNAPPSLDLCLNQMWYNLLSCDDNNVEVKWRHNMSPTCQTEIQAYFKSKGISLVLK